MVACRDDSAAVPENLNRIIGIVPPAPPPGDGQFTRVVKRGRAAGKSFMVGNRAHSSGIRNSQWAPAFTTQAFAKPQWLNEWHGALLD